MPVVLPPDDLFEALFDLSDLGTILFAPVRDAMSEMVDLAYVRLNAAAQRMLALPEYPTESFLTRYPHAQAAGIFAFYRAAYDAGETQRARFNYQHDGLDNYYHLAARRVGEQLLVSFSDTSEQPRTAVEQALRESQAREQATQAATEAERQRMHTVLMQLPANIILLSGPEQVSSLVNPGYTQLFPDRALLGYPFRAAVPELAGQGYFELLDQVYQTGEPVYQQEAQTWADFHGTGQLERRYYNTSFLAIRDAQGQVAGVLNFAVDVTAQVLARQQVEQLNEELELRVTARSAEARAALFEAEQQREQLGAQQALLGQILRQVPAAIATLSGPEHRYSFFNDPYQALAAGRAGVGRTVAEVFPEVVKQGFTALLDQVYATGQPFIGTATPALLHDQATGQAEQRYVDFVYQPLVDGQQRTQGVLSFIVDVTAKVLARQQADTLQAALLAVAQRQHQAREHAYQLFEQAPAAICLLRGSDHRIDYLNPAYQALFPGRALRGHTLAEAQPDNPALVTLLSGVYASSQAQFQAEVPVLLPLHAGEKPRTCYFDFTYQVYREDDRIAGVSLFGFEVTERVRSRRVVEANAQRLKLLTDALPVLIGYLDRDRRYQFTNKAYEAWFNQPAEALLGRPVREVAGEVAYQNISPYIDRALAGERVGFAAHMPFRADFVKHIQTDYIPDVQHGEVLGFYTLVTDVTEQVQAREALAALNEELTATNKELHTSNTRLTRTNTDLDTFVYTASHDLKAPIANIEGILAALRETLPPAVQQDEVVAHLLGLLDRTVSRFLTTIDQLTDLSRLQQTYNEPAELLALAPVVAGVVEDLQPQLMAAAAQLHLAVPAGLHVSFAPASLRSIVYNLLSNATKYRDPARPAQVWLQAEQQPGQVVLSVRDNGLGLSETQQKRLFGVFQRLHTHVEGSGVGLYMIKRLIDNAGATITVASAPGVGSTFTVTFPT